VVCPCAVTCILREDEFISPKHRIRTTSRFEWYLVVDPALALDALGVQAWEAGSIDGAAYTPQRFGSRRIASPTSECMQQRIARINEQLAVVGDKEPLSLEHFCALRMYTGPCHVKYDYVLQATRCNHGNSFVDGYVAEVCKGNHYETSILHMCLGIEKLARLSQASTVYLAPSGPLPRAFAEVTRDEWAHGGVEVGFTSASTNLDEAKGSAASRGSAIVLEMRQGAIPCGAHLSWLSQFSLNETECLFAPLLALEANGHRMDGGFVIVELRALRSSAAQRTALELDKLRMDELLFSRLCTVDGQHALCEFAASLELKRDMALETVMKGPSDFQHHVLKLRNLTKADQVRRRLRAEAAAFAKDEAAQSARMLDEILDRAGAHAEVKALAELRQRTAAQADLREEEARTASWGLMAREREIAELEAATRLDAPSL